MELRLQPGDVFQIPKGCRVQINDNTFEVKGDEYESYRPGEIIVFESDNDELSGKCIALVREVFERCGGSFNVLAVTRIDQAGAISPDCHIYPEVGDPGSHFCVEDVECRRATREESHEFQAVMLRNGYRWSPRSLQLTRVLPRQDYGDIFYFIDQDFTVHDCCDLRGWWNNELYDFGNYFMSEHDAAQFAGRLRALLEVERQQADDKAGRMPLNATVSLQEERRRWVKARKAERDEEAR